MRTRIKICGIKRPQDAELAAQLGVDAIGLVFYAASPRFVDTDQAQLVVRATTPFVNCVGLFLDATADYVGSVLSAVDLDLLQFHGRESKEFCESFGKKYLKSVPMLDAVDLAVFMARYPSASGFLLDAVQDGEAGGQGRTFSWSDIPKELTASMQQPLILAGGLSPENVAEAIRVSGCCAVDVSSGVESEKGVKSAEKMRQFVNNVEMKQ
jgi:phosphoribosylanthranilate isomerase